MAVGPSPGGGPPEPSRRPAEPTPEKPDGRTSGAQARGGRRAGFLSALLAVLIPLGIALTVFLALVGGDPLATAPVVAGATTLALVAACGLASRGRTDAAAGLSVLVVVAGCLAMVVLPTAVPDPVPYAFLAVPVAMSSLLLPTWATGGLAAVPLVSEPRLVQGSLAALTAMVGGLLTVGSHLSNRDRRRLRRQRCHLERTRAWLREAQRVAGVGAFPWSPGEDPWWSSPQVYQVLGYEPGEIDASLETIREHVHPGGRDRFERELAASLEDPGEGALECRMVAGDGRTIHAVWRTDALVRDDGAPSFVGALRDVTDRKRYETLRRRMALEEGRRGALERFVRIASHEFREPIRTAGTALQRIEHELDAGEGARLAEPIASAREAIGRLERVTDSLVTFTETLARPLEAEPVDADEALEEALANLRDRLGAEPTVRWDELPEVEADRAFLVSVFEELIANAVDHGGETISVDARRREGAWAFVVADDGDGIPTEHLEAAFEPFEQLDREGWTEHTGLGLALVQRLVDRHGGTVEARAGPHGGIEVAFAIPDGGPPSADPTPSVGPARGPAEA